MGGTISILKSKRYLLISMIVISILSTVTVLSITISKNSATRAAYFDWLHSVIRFPSAATFSSAEARYSSQSPTGQPLYQIQATLDSKSHVIQGVSRITMKKPASDHIIFYLYPYLPSPLQIQSVQIQSKQTNFTANDSALSVPLGSVKGDQLTVEIHFSLNIPDGGYRLGTIDQTWSLVYWYPILGIFDGEKWLPRPTPQPFGDPYLTTAGDYEVSLTYPKDWTWFTSGRILRTTTPSTGLTKSTWNATDVHSFALVGGPTMMEKSWVTGDGVHVSIGGTFGDQEEVNTLQAMTQKTMKFYTSIFGSYAQDSLSVVELPAGTIFAHEYPNMALYAKDLELRTDANHWIAHEIAHGWWYSSVADLEARTPWLDEGLADYSAYLFEESINGKKVYEADMMRLRELFIKEQSYAPNDYKAPILLRNGKTDAPYESFSNEADYYYYEYLRTVLMYDQLRHDMGDQVFFAWLQQFYVKNRLKTASRADLESALSDVDARWVPRLRFWLDAPNTEIIRWIDENPRTG